LRVAGGSQRDYHGLQKIVVAYLHDSIKRVLIAAVVIAWCEVPWREQSDADAEGSEQHLGAHTDMEGRTMPAMMMTPQQPSVPTI
jgi:hypothetical protein